MSAASARRVEPRRPAEAARTGLPRALVLELAAPELTGLLRAGLGGLASALRVLAIADDPRSAWPSPVALGDGTAIVEPRRITLRFGPQGPTPLLEALFARVFAISQEGVIAPAGILEPTLPRDRGLRLALHLGMKRTFLQHGKSTTAAGAMKLLTFEVDGRSVRYPLLPCSAYAHQAGASAVLKALARGTVELAGWAYPGAVQKHTGVARTRCEYGPVEAICALFALIGCISLPTARGGAGVVVIPHPTDLVAFAVTRPRLGPASFAEAHVAGLGDAVLAVYLALRRDDVAAASGGVDGAEGVLLRALPWAPQQRSRARTLSMGAFGAPSLDTYELAARTLPPSVRDARGEGDPEDGGDGSFVASSALRGFIADNLAEGRRWYAGFATATTGGARPRFVHRYRERGNRGLGALYLEEKRGIIAMLDELGPAEHALVCSVHLALRQRFHRIAFDARASGATPAHRFRSERERWRIAFAGSRTAGQLRAALVDLWSRAGINGVLRESWEHVIPLLQGDHWQLARDLALVALVSYQRRISERGGDHGDHDDEPSSLDDRAGGAPR
ncbi:MAG TPA: type I-MYXAN CRISPR-associated Cas8a1/Cmx1 [Kofleriaceae bacterium]|nr:type I-MYXAN CRISPR-associated Cas8a1/Cmx1 [Kofleriaceae bacterium]